MRSWRRPFEVEVHQSPEEPLLHPRRIQLWLFDLDQPPQKGYRILLSPEELLRTRRLKDPNSKSRSAVGFARTRQVLSSVSGFPPEEITFALGVCGKPRLIQTTARAEKDEVHFNTSHSQNIMAIATAFAREVGVDVEVVDRRSRQSFYLGWSKEEAVAKLAGVGLATGGPIKMEKPCLVKSSLTKFAGKEISLAVAAYE